MIHLTLFLIYLKNNFLKRIRFSCWWECIPAVHEVKLYWTWFHRSQSRTRVKRKTNSGLFSNSVYDAFYMDIESSECIFLLNLSAELLLFLVEPPVCEQNWGFLKESPVSEGWEGKVFEMILFQQTVKSNFSYF